MLSRLCRFASGIVKFLWSIVTVLFKARKAIQVEGSKQGGNRWNDDWEEFSVSVVPNKVVEDTTTKTVAEVGGDKDSDDVLNQVLNEMQPVIKKTQKIRIVSSSTDNPGRSLDFTVQDNIQQETNVEDLGTWNDNDSKTCWEEELLQDEGELIQATQTVLKENRKKERDSRRQINHSMRAQQRTTAGPSLGIKHTLAHHQ